VGCRPAMDKGLLLRISESHRRNLSRKSEIFQAILSKGDAAARERRGRPTGNTQQCAPFSGGKTKPLVGSLMLGSGPFWTFQSLRFSRGLSFLSFEHSVGLAFDIVTHGDVASVRTIRDGWLRLARDAGVTPSQGWDYAMAAWDARHSKSQARLNIISISVNGEVELIWPLVVERVGFVRVANHLGCGNNEEYALPLCRPGPMQGRLLSAAMEALRGRADVLNVWNIPVDSALAAQIEALPARRTTEVMCSPVVEGPTRVSWDIWWAGRSRSFRWRLKRDRKRLAELGTVSFGRVSDPAEIEAAVTRLFDLKRDWLKARDVRRSWIYQPASREFYSSVIPKVDGIYVHALKLNSSIVSLAIIYESDNCVEYYAPAFDPEYSSFRPGNLLIENILQYCFEKGVLLDFRLTQDSYKMRWSDGSRRYARYVLSLSGSGDVFVLLLRFRPLWHRFKAWVKSVLKAVRAVPGSDEEDPPHPD